MAKYLLDTNICVYIMRGKYNIAQKIKELGIKNCRVSEITYAELLYGAECSDSPLEILLIACCALANDFIMVTDNMKHFNRIPGLTIQNLVERQ